jgi:sugar lactone lactonase YvrE
MRCLPVLLLAAACTPTTDDPDGSVTLAATYDLSESVGFPEGIAFHEALRAFVVGSLAHGGITRVDADGTETRLFDPDGEGWSSLGVKLHPDTNEALFCAVNQPSEPEATSELWVVDVETGDQRAIALSSPPANCNDVVAVGDDVYLTDRESNRIHRVDLAAGTSEIWLEDDLLTPQLIGNNGIVATDDALLVGQYAPARLLRVPLDDPSGIAEITLSGDAIGTVPDGADGIIWFEGDLLIAANRKVARVSSSDGWQTATVTSADAAVPVAALTEAEGQLYGLKGEVPAFVLGTAPQLPFQIVALDAP